jgi:acetyl esterase/lipase
VTPDRRGNVDVYLPDTTDPRPAIVFVHGGPVPAEVRPTPRDWPLYRGYGSLAVARGVVGVTVDHRLHHPAAYPSAAADVAEAVRTARELPQVDPDRIAVWFFSGSGLLLADWLRTPPDWLRCLAATYPLVAPIAGWPVDPAYRPIETVAEAATPPIVLTRAGLEHPEVAAAVEEFVTAAGPARLEVIDVPNGRHGFDMLDHTEESRQAVEKAFDTVLAHLNRPDA